MSKVKADAEKKITKAKLQLVLSQPFFGCLLLQTPIEENSQLTATMATNGKGIIYNSNFVKNLRDEEIQGVLCHEILHMVLLHCSRLKERNPVLWNIACDYAINPLLIHSNFMLPKGVLYDRQFENKSAEEIYKILREKNNWQSMKLPMEDLKEGPSDPEHAARMKRKLVQAKQAAQRAGKMPASIARMIDDLVTPKIPWEEQLRRYFANFVPSPETNWLRPNRRFIHSSLYLPGKTKTPKMQNCVLVIDTSGSITSKHLKTFASEINAIKDEISIENVYVVYCDADVAKVDYFDEYSPVVFDPIGGGGTDFRPAFNWVKEQGVVPDVLVYFTDGYGDYPETVPSYPTLWVLTEPHEVPFGDKILLD
jgi:predicted metal-dependent peptidase